MMGLLNFTEMVVFFWPIINYSYLLASINNAAINTDTQLFVQIYTFIFLDISQKVEFCGRMILVIL